MEPMKSKYLLFDVNHDGQRRNVTRHPLNKEHHARSAAVMASLQVESTKIEVLDAAAFQVLTTYRNGSEIDND